MKDNGDRSGWVLLLVIATGLALGAWLAVWVAGIAASTPLPGEPSVERDAAGEALAGAPGFAMLQVLQASAPGPPLRLPAGSESLARVTPRILLVALPTFGPRQRVFLFIRPADPVLCRSLHGVELAVQWNGAEPTAVCAVADPPPAEPPPPVA